MVPLSHGRAWDAMPFFGRKVVYRKVLMNVGDYPDVT